MSALNTGALNPLPPSGASPDKRVYEPSMEEILASIRRIIADDQSLPGRGAGEREDASRGEPLELRRASIPPHPLELAPSLHEELPPRGSEPVSVAADLAPASSAHASQPVALDDSSSGAPSPAHPPHAQRAYGTIAAPQYAMPDRGYAPEPEVVPPPVQPASAAVGLAPTHDVEETDDFAPLHRSVAASPDAQADEAGLEEPFEAPQPELPAEAPGLFSAATDSSVSAAFNMLAASRLADNSDELMNMVREMIRPLLRNWLDDNLPSMVERMVRAEIERVARGGR